MVPGLFDHLQGSSRTPALVRRAAKEEQPKASSGEVAGEGASPRATVFSVVALNRLRMRPSFMQRHGPRACQQYLRSLAHPSLCSGEKSWERARHLAPSGLDRASLALRQMETPADQQSLSHKELVFLQHNRRAARCLRDDLWRWSIGEVKKTAEQREWGDVPYEVARALVKCRKNRSDTRFHVPRLWALWPPPLQQPEHDWDEVYVDEFPEVSDSFAHPGDATWDTVYTVFTKHWLTHPSRYMKTALGLPDIPTSASPLPARPNPAEQLDFAIRALGGRISRESSLHSLPQRLLWSHAPTPCVARRGAGNPPGGTCLRPSCKRKKWSRSLPRLPNQVRSLRSCRGCSPSAWSLT